MESNSKNNLALLTITGILLYLFLFSIAVLLFPGGNNHDVCRQGFSFFHNYWCDLMSPVCRLGVPNPSMPFAKTGHIVLSISTGMFFYILPFIFKKNTSPAVIKVIRICGLASMLIFIFMFTNWHDPVTIGTAFFGSIALAFSFYELKEIQEKKIFWGVVLCLSLCLLVFVIYQTGAGIYWLPLLQKITLLTCLSWMIWISIKIRKK